jgi:hypothetical protein
MAILVKYNSFIDQLSKAGHNMPASIFKCALTNTTPNAAADTVWSAAVYPPPAAANGYPAGGNQPVNSSVFANGLYKLVLQDTVFTASGGVIGPFRYVILYNSSAANKLVGYYDYGASISLNDTDTFTTDFDDTNGVLTIA